MNNVIVDLARAAIRFASTDLEMCTKYMDQAARDVQEGSTVALRSRVKYTERRLQSARNQIDAALALLRSDHE